jgi:hypothetical protein
MFIFIGMFIFFMFATLQLTSFIQPSFAYDDDDDDDDDDDILQRLRGADRVPVTPDGRRRTARLPVRTRAATRRLPPHR